MRVHEQWGCMGGWVLGGGGLGYGSILEYYYKYTMLYFQMDLVQRENKACLESHTRPVENIT